MGRSGMYDMIGSRNFFGDFKWVNVGKQEDIEEYRRLCCSGIPIIRNLEK